MGHRSVAKELYRLAADGIRYGTIAYADASGGVGEGLLLWYAGITTKDRNATEHALDYLTRLAKKPRIKSWPGPLAQFVLERQSFNEVLRDSFKTDNLLETAEQAKSEILKRPACSSLICFRNEVSTTARQKWLSSSFAAMCAT